MLGAVGWLVLIGDSWPLSHRPAPRGLSFTTEKLGACLGLSAEGVAPFGVGAGWPPFAWTLTFGFAVRRPPSLRRKELWNSLRP